MGREGERILVEHKGHTIVFGDDEKWWLRVDGSNVYCNDSLKKVKQYVDRMESKEFERLQAFVRPGWRWGRVHETDENSGFVEVEVTSVTEDGDAWVRSGKSREKRRKIEIVLKTPENIAKIEQMRDLRKQMAELGDRCSEIEKGLERLK